jgi:hypothetical protein
MQISFDPLNQQLYALALLAALPEKRVDTERATEIAMPVQLESWVTPARSREEAAQFGLDVALELWPVSQGWFGHSVRVLEIKFTREYPTVDAEMVKEERVM